MHCLKFTLLLALLVLPEPAPAWKSDTVKVWARALGDELWKLSEALTKSDQIRVKYKQMNASVKKKDGNQILESSLLSVSRMLTRKIKAVKCIHATAEELARNFNYSATDENNPFEYCSAKYSKFTYNDPGVEAPSDENFPKFALNRTNYMNITLEKDSHFYNISVNTNTSCVHVPTNIFYKEKNSLNDILWSKGLNEVFTRNYKSDPSLVWQYFGSSHGILRFYPGMPWNKKEHYVDTYDCRVKSWYIEAATCSKDVIILFDVSGSMTGFKNYVARRTLRSLLETLSNNDFVNVYTYKNKVDAVVSCFKHLVQATPENLNTLSETLEPIDDEENHKVIHNVPLEGTANLTAAYITAFEELRKKRVHCNVSSTQGCNQLVMVITDYVPGNLTEVFEEYNREVIDNKTYIPVRVFTYLIGKEVTNVREIQWMACLNRGYFVHIHSVEEVQQQVLKYINVIARPMILEKKEPPPTWTHANIDSTRTSEWNVSADVHKPDEDKLVTSVAIPAFDYNYNEENNDAMLLGVAGTDVPIDSIAKLAQPHQLGVNGYSFIVSNNGYLLLHPLLTTTINGVLQKNYNSVDFVEVEQVDDGKGSREYGNQITKLRENLVNGVDGNMMEIKVLYHYDKMRRIARVKHDYFFNKLEGTPFSMGISLPRRYGDTELWLKDNPLEAKRGKDLTGINVTDYFKFSYRVHPDWVYCKYHYLEGHETQNAEEEIWNFLVGLSKNEIDITKKQYKEEPQPEKFNPREHCGSGETGTEDYYCTEDLVKQLVFDAKLSTPYFQNWTATSDQLDLAKTYDVTVRFIATSSGLTRWHYIFDADKNEQVDDSGTRSKKYNGEVFGDKYYNAIEETWYKAAVLQHMINTESLVIATPLPILDEIIKEKSPVINEDTGDITITASYAIFYKDWDSFTPASVVGFEYSYLKFYERFLHITNATLDGSQDPTCSGSDQYKCYLIDSSGYIVLAKDKTKVGQFFGTVQPYVLQSFMLKGIFDRVEVFNYQALCKTYLFSEENSGWSLETPFGVAFKFFQWLVTEALLVIFNWKNFSYAYNGGEYNDYNDINDSAHTDAPTTQPSIDAHNESNSNRKGENGNTNEPFSCDHSIMLYKLNQLYFLDATGATPTVYEDEAGACHPAYWAAYVKKTNLLLVVVENEYRQYGPDCTVPRDTKPQPTFNSTNRREPCHKLNLAELKRRPLDGCYTYHDGERNITACGMASITRLDVLVFLAATVSGIAAAWRGS